MYICVSYVHLVSSCIDLSFLPSSSIKAPEESNFFPWTFVLLLGWFVCFETGLNYSSGWHQAHYGIQVWLQTHDESSALASWILGLGYRHDSSYLARKIIKEIKRVLLVHMWPSMSYSQIIWSRIYSMGLHHYILFLKQYFKLLQSPQKTPSLHKAYIFVLIYYASSPSIIIQIISFYLLTHVSQAY